MINKTIGPREYKTLSIPNVVIINPTRYLSKPDGYVEETADFTELSYFLGYKFEPRCTYTMWSPKGIGRGGYVESRSKIITVVSGLIYFALVDMRPGTGQSKTCEFYLGEGNQSLGISVLIPEGVITYYVPVSGPALTHSTGNRPYNKFDSSRVLDMSDPALKLHLPKDTLRHTPVEETISLLSLKELTKDL